MSSEIDSNPDKLFAPQYFQRFRQGTLESMGKPKTGKADTGASKILKAFVTYCANGFIGKTQKVWLTKTGNSSVVR